MHEKKRKPDEAGHKVLGLEIIRFICAVSILVWHYSHFSFIGKEQVNFYQTSQPFYWLLIPMYRYGNFGVQIFWCVSGYIFFWKYGGDISSRLMSGKRFFVLRFSRLYPLHFVTLLAAGALQYLYISTHTSYFVFQANHLSDFLAQIFMASDWGIPREPGFNAPIWSISVEVLAYFIFYTTLRIFRGRLISSAIVLSVSIAALTLGATLPLFQCLIFFYAGGLIALACEYGQKYRGKLTVASILIMLVPILYHLSKNLLHFTMPPMLFLLAFVPPLLYLMAEYFHAPSYSHKLIEAAGNITYSSYLLHFPIQICIACIYSELAIPIPYYSKWFFLCYIGGILALSRWVFEAFEKPAQSTIRNWLLKANPPVASPVVQG